MSAAHVVARCGAENWAAAVLAIVPCCALISLILLLTTARVQEPSYSPATAQLQPSYSPACLSLLSTHKLYHES